LNQQESTQSPYLSGAESTELVGREKLQQQLLVRSEKQIVELRADNNLLTRKVHREKSRV